MWLTKKQSPNTHSLIFQRKVPVYESMFSSLPHHPWYTLDLHPVDPVPEFIDRTWHGCRDERKETLHQLAG